jgi:hypothetical protein
MGYLKFITTGYKLTAIPETAGGFHGHYINHAGKKTHYPAHNIIHFVKIHIALILKNWQI